MDATPAEPPAPILDSTSVGDRRRHQPLDQLEQSLAALPALPADAGRVVLLVRRGEGGRREAPARVRLDPEAGLPGDAWGRRADRKPEAELAAMQIDVARLIANGQPLELFGDNLFLELDLSHANLPPGSRLQAGGATLEVMPKPHNGCSKFGARFGPDALHLVAKQEHRARNLRGIYLRVVAAGEVAPGDRVAVLARGA